MKVARDQLLAHVQQWSASPLHTSSSWLPRYLYHFTDVRNAAQILQDGELLSRNEAVRRCVMKNDNASSQVISVTAQRHMDYARLYFRPRTPTQYHNEGIRPLAARGLGAHCPVPIFLAFDLVETLRLDGVKFSNGNLASSQAVVSDQADAFAALPFELIYHEGPVDPARKRAIVFHRHAEVLAPSVLPLRTLRWIGCRSNAERESLLYLLGQARPTWEPVTSVAPGRLYNRLGCCVEAVQVADEHIQFALHVPNGWSLRIGFELTSDASGRMWRWASDSWSGQQLRMHIRGLEPGVVHLYIEDCLAYASRIQPADVPF